MVFNAIWWVYFFWLIFFLFNFFRFYWNIFFFNFYKIFCKNVKLITATQVLLAPLTTLVDNGKNWLVEIPVTLKQFQLLGNDGSTVGINIKFTALNFDPPKMTSFSLKMNPNGLTPLAGLINYKSDQPAMLLLLDFLVVVHGPFRRHPAFRETYKKDQEAFLGTVRPDH